MVSGLQGLRRPIEQAAGMARVNARPRLIQMVAAPIRFAQIVYGIPNRDPGFFGRLHLQCSQAEYFGSRTGRDGVILGPGQAMSVPVASRDPLIPEQSRHSMGRLRMTGFHAQIRPDASQQHAMTHLRCPEVCCIHQGNCCPVSFREPAQTGKLLLGGFIGTARVGTDVTQLLLHPLQVRPESRSGEISDILEQKGSWPRFPYGSDRFRPHIAGVAGAFFETADPERLARRAAAHQREFTPQAIPPRVPHVLMRHVPVGDMLHPTLGIESHRRDRVGVPFKEYARPEAGLRQPEAQPTASAKQFDRVTLTHGQSAPRQGRGEVADRHWLPRPSDPASGG